MTVSTRTSAPSYKIFEPDALDQIYAKGALDPMMGGIAGSLALSHGANKAGYQDRYLASQKEFNNLAANLDMAEMDNRRKIELLKGAVDLIGKGAATPDLDPGSLVGLYTAPGYQNDTLGKSLRDLNAAKAQGARASGASTNKDYYTIQRPIILDDGTSGMQTVKTFGTPPANASTGGAAGDKSRVINQNVVKAVAAALGPDAQGERMADGGTKWQSPSKPGVVIMFDAQGNAKR